MSIAFPALFGLLPACGEAVSVTVTPGEEVPTVITISWSTAEPSTGYVEFGEGTALDRVTALETLAAVDHRRTLVGLAADTAYSYRVSDSAETSAFVTGPLSPELPSLTPSATGDAGPGWIATVLDGRVPSSVLLDSLGRITWWDLADGDLPQTRAWVSRDHTAMLSNRAAYADAVEDGSGAEIVRVPFDGSPRSRLSFPFHNHDFIEMADGTFAGIRYEIQDVAGEPYLGDALVELSPEGDERVVWNAFDHLDPADYAQVSFHHGWTHANAVDYQPDDDTYLLSLRNFGSILKIRRDTGEQVWAFGGIGNTFTFTDGLPELTAQHQFELLGDRLIVFDNGLSERGYSQISEYEIDESALTASLVWTHKREPAELVSALGDVARLDDGSTLVNWSLLGQIERVNPDHSVQWSLSAELATVFGYSSPVASLD